MTELRIGVPNEKQRRFLLDRHRHIAYGGARGGGKSWAVRTKAKLLALRYAADGAVVHEECMEEFLLEALGLRRLAAQAGYRYERGEDTDA